jgi:hypothetical protein
MMSLLLFLVVGGLILLAALGIGALVLIKMGVIGSYALKQEPSEQGDYTLEESHEVKD